MQTDILELLQLNIAQKIQKICSLILRMMLFKNTAKITGDLRKEIRSLTNNFKNT